MCGAYTYLKYYLVSLKLYILLAVGGKCSVVHLRVTVRHLGSGTRDSYSVPPGNLSPGTPVAAHVKAGVACSLPNPLSIFPFFLKVGRVPASMVPRVILSKLPGGMLIFVA